MIEFPFAIFGGTEFIPFHTMDKNEMHSVLI